MIAGIVTGIGCIAGIVVYFVKKTLLESLFSTLLGHLVLTDIFYNFSQNYIFDLRRTSDLSVIDHSSWCSYSTDI